MAVISGEDCRLLIRGLTGSAEDATLEKFVDRVDASIARYLGFPLNTEGLFTLESKSYVLYLDGMGSDRLHLPLRPVSAIASIIDDPDLDYSDSSDLVPASDYVLYGDEGLVILKADSTHGIFSSTPRSVKVSLTAGFPSMPHELKQAIGLQVAHVFQGRDHVGRTEVSQGGGSIDVLGLGLLPEVKELVAPWRMGSSWLA